RSPLVRNVLPLCGTFSPCAEHQAHECASADRYARITFRRALVGGRRQRRAVLWPSSREAEPRSLALSRQGVTVRLPKAHLQLLPCLRSGQVDSSHDDVHVPQGFQSKSSCRVAAALRRTRVVLTVVLDDELRLGVKKV